MFGRFKLFTVMLAVLTVVAWGGLATAQETSPTIGFNDFSFQLDSALPTNVNIVQVAAMDPELMVPGGPEPAHTRFTFYAEPPASESVFERGGGLYLYRIADMTDYEGYTEQVALLQSLLADRTDLSTFYALNDDMSVGTLPFLPVVPAAQVTRAHAEYVDTGSVQGIRYLTAYRQDASPFLSRDFLFTFQGISSDGQYYISLIAPLETTLFPSEMPADFDYDEFSANLMTYLDEVVATLNAGTPGDFSPNLSLLDNLVQSMQVAAAG